MKIACEIGFAPPVLVDVASLLIDHYDSELIQLVGDYKIIIFIKCTEVKLSFVQQLTYRLFKIQQKKSSHNVVEVKH